MRVCLVGPAARDDAADGCARRVAEAARALCAAGVEVWHLPVDGAAPDTAAALAGVLALPDLGLPRHAFAPRLAGAAARVAEALAAAGPFDYVEFADAAAPGYVVLEDARLLGRRPAPVLGVAVADPLRERLVADGLEHALGPREREACLLEDRAIASADLLRAPYRDLLDRVLARLAADDRRTAAVVPVPLDLPGGFPPRPRRTRLEELRIGFLGDLEPRSGLGGVLGACRMLGLELLVLGGDTPTSPFGTSYRATLGIGAGDRVRVEPLPASRARLREVLAGLDVCIVPPHATVLAAEAMAAGAVVVGGGDEVEHGLTGFAAEPGDAAGLARVLAEEVGRGIGRLPELAAAGAERARTVHDPVRFARHLADLVAAAREARARAESGIAGRGAAGAARAVRVAVVVPYHDEPAAVVDEAVASALAQDGLAAGGAGPAAELEVVVVDDGSTAAHAAPALAALAARDPRVRVLHKPNGGLASARNHALERIDADFLLMLDADNVLRRDYVATALEVFARDPSIDAVAPQCIVFEDGTRRPLSVLNALPWDRALALWRNAFGDAGAIFRSSVFREHGLRYDPAVDLYSDWALWLDCARLGLRVERLPRVLYEYRRHPASMMSEQAWQRHLPLLGLLIERHLGPAANAAEERALLVTLVRAWGVGALLGSLEAQRDEVLDAPVGVALGLRGALLRHRIADRCAAWLGRVPGAGVVGRRVVGPLFAWHGRRKDRRSRGG